MDELPFLLLDVIVRPSLDSSTVEVPSMRSDKRLELLDPLHLLLSGIEIPSQFGVEFFL